MAQHTIDCQCIADTYCSHAATGANYGSATILRAGGLQVEDYGDIYYALYYALLKFDVPELVRRSKLNYAGVRIYSTKAVAPAVMYYGINDKDWEENTANYENQGNKYLPGTDGRSVPSGMPANNWVEIDITDRENDIIAGIASGEIVTKGIFLEYIYTGYLSAFAEFHSRENTNKPVLRITYEILPPEKPILVSPVGEYQDNTRTIRFTWQYVGAMSGTQKKFDLQWSTDQVNWNTISQETSNTYYDMPGGTLPGGNIFWRVRTHNHDDDVGSWSDTAVFYCIGEVAVPEIISVTNNCRPAVTWSVATQQVFQIQILKDDEVVYDSGSQPGINVRSFRVKDFLHDGNYTARLRVKNEFDLWSDWVEYEFAIATIKPEKPIIAVQRSPYGLELTIGNVQGDAYIYRDGIPIAKATGQKYYDNTVANDKEYRYFVRALSGNGFADSDVVIGIPAFRIGLLNVGEKVIELKYNLNSVPGKDLSCVPVGAMNHYDGREFPIAEMSEFTDVTLSLTYFFRRFTKVEKILEAARRKKTVLYRDKKGLKLYGIISNVAIRDLINGYTVSFTLSATDHNEAVEI